MKFLIDKRRQLIVASTLAMSGTALLLITLLLMWVNSSFDPNVLSYLFIFNAFLPVGWLIATRRPENAIGWLFLGIAVTTNLSWLLVEYARRSLVTVPGSLPGGVWAALLSQFIQPAAWMLMFTSLLLFPTGKPLNRGWGIFIGVNIILFQFIILLGVIARPALTYFPDVPNPLDIESLAGFANQAASIVGFTNVGALVVTAILRLRRTDPIEKLQLKWFVYGVVLWAILQPAAQLVFNVPGDVAGNLGFVGILFPLTAIAIAILRYHLYDIDLIIRRTLVYAIITAVLGFTYWGGVVLLQSLIPAAMKNNDLAIVASTLAVAALFLPVRRVARDFIDRRFYRRRYDAAKTVEAFSRAARDEVDLDRLTGRLIEVVDETMQPAGVWLWLRQPGRKA